jgi:transcriptional regulator with XRE-family HTH domain
MKRRREKDPGLVRFGERVRALRAERGWSQEELADICSLHRTYIGGIERGEKNLSLKNIRKLADSLDITLSKLFEEA